MTSSIAAREARPSPTVLQNPCTSPVWRLTLTRTAQPLQPGGVLLALVAQHVEPGHGDVRRREAVKVVGEQR